MKRAGLFCVFLGASLFAAAAAQSHRPNIPFAFADDWGRHASAYARIDGPGTVNDLLQTPQFDRVAREGVLFRSAFVSAPSCTPCRSALLSGQHFWRTGDPRLMDDGRFFETPPMAGPPEDLNGQGADSAELRGEQ